MTTMTDWQPIEALGDHGGEYIAYGIGKDGKGKIGMMIRLQGDPFGNCLNAKLEYITPTHWMPLPEPPK